jgi:L-ascorbate metabolism protein UlaG (beta-lactamase superfamily)
LLNGEEQVVRNPYRHERRAQFEQLENRCLLANSPILAGAHLIYNNSSFDGNDPAAAVSDDTAIVNEKSWLLPGQTASFENYSSYDKGINALAIDVRNLGSAPDNDDFDFKAGTTADPSTWAAAPAPTSISVRAGAGVGGADRVTIVWGDGAIKNTWLQVTLVASGSVFYFGNAVGETGNSAANAFVSAADEIAVRTQATPPGGSAAIENPHDFNRDAVVDSADELIARNNRRLLANSLPLVTAPHVAALNLVADSDSPTVGLANEVVHYAYELYNTGSVALTNITLDANLGTAEARQADVVGDGDNLLEAGEVWRYTNTLTVTQLQLNAGVSLVNMVTADSDETPADNDDTTSTIASLQGDVFGNLTIRPITHASFFMTYQGKTIYVDPDSPTSLYTGLPKADFILISHDHGDHFDTAAINAVINTGTKIVAPQIVFNALPVALRNVTTVIDYNAGTPAPNTLDFLDELNNVLFNVKAVPAYNANHPFGNGNGYIVTIDQKRIFISGDTGSQRTAAELAELQNIDIAFLCMNTPFTMTPQQADTFTRTIRPKVVYPYHYRNQDGSLGNAITFKNLMSTDFSIEVRLRKWY